MPGVLALYGPTASGKSEIARLVCEQLGGEIVSADSAALYEGVPILTAAPTSPALLVGMVPLDRDVSVGGYQRLAHLAIDSILAREVPAIVVGGTGLYIRAALSTLGLPPPPAPGVRERWTAFYDEHGAEHAHALLASQDPAAAARVHQNDRRRVIRALELVEVGSSLVPAESRLWSDEVRRPTLLVGLQVSNDALDARIRARVERMVTEGVVAEAARAWARPLSSTARKVLGLEQFATLPLAEAVEAVVTATGRLARYQQKWLRRLPLAATLEGERPPEEVADELVALVRARSDEGHS